MSQMPPPGQYAYGDGAAFPHGATRVYRSARGLAVALLVLLSVMGLLSLLRAAAPILGLHALRVPSLYLWLIGVLATGVVFIIWQYRHAVNAELLRGGNAGLGPAWAIGGWFIPLANVVLPCIQILGSSRPSDPSPPAPPHPSPQRDAGSSIVVWWAVAFGGAWFTVLLAPFVPYDFRRSASMLTVGSLMYGGAAVLAAVMVWQLTNRQDRRAAAQGLAPGRAQAAAAGQVPGWGAPAPQQPYPPAGPSQPPAGPSGSVPRVGPWLPPGQTPS